MIEKIEHIGIAVKNIDEANRVYEQLLGIAPYKTEKVDTEGVNTSFFQTGDSKIELLEATREDSPIAKFIKKRGEGIHHIAFTVADIYLEMQRLKDNGLSLLNDLPMKGADNKLICFIHPNDSHGVLVELCQEIIE